jgi:hypothetical protein
MAAYAAFFLFIIATSAHAHDRFLEPPDQYLINPGVEVIVNWNSLRITNKLCQLFLRSREEFIACAVRTIDGKICGIYVPTGMSRKWKHKVLRHEFAHCYGWRHG